MASITEKKDKNGKVISYVIRVYRGYSSNGERLKPYIMTWKPPKGMTEKQIAKALNSAAVRFEQECAEGEIAQPAMKLDRFCEKYLEIMKPVLSPSTYECYCNLIKRTIIPKLGHLQLDKITTAHVQDFVQWLSNHPKSERNGVQSETEVISPSTVHRYLSVLQSILRLAMKLGLITDTPARAEKLTLPRTKKGKIEIFSKSEAAEMLSCLEKEPLQFQTLVQLAIFSGARRGELVALKFSDIDYEQRKVTIERAAVKVKGEPTRIKPPKDYESRCVTVSPSCIELVKMLRAEKDIEAAKLGSEWHENDWIFTQSDGQIMNVQTPSKQFEKFLKRNGLKHRKFHSLRHTSATLLLYGGVNVRQVQNRLGHGKIETTNMYLHILEEADTQAADVLGKMLLSHSSDEDEKSNNQS